ncbi:MAG TPA: family 20 glycosylhydrolase [Opitutaceae bacterium]|nr:family 20 glycosylhydrolase [Opitutaceae bacterium]
MGAMLLISASANERLTAQDGIISEPDFGRVLCAALDCWFFSPAAKAAARWRYSLAPNSLKLDATGRLVQGLRANDTADMGVKGLDGQMHPVHQISPVYPAALSDEKTTGDATITFIIDREVHGRLARVNFATRAEFGWAADGIADSQLLSASSGGKPGGSLLLIHGKPRGNLLRVPLSAPCFSRPRPALRTAGRCLVVVFVLLGLTHAHGGDLPSPPVMPLPADWTYGEGRLAVTPAFTVGVAGHDGVRLQAAVEALLCAWRERTGMVFARPPAAGATMVIECGGPASPFPVLGEDETYTIEVEPARAVLRAPTEVGALRGLATLQQLLEGDAAGWRLPAIRIRDGPRFAWRGLLIDVSRHWMPIEVIKRELDGMAMVKLNVLHLHLTDDQGFRVASQRFPRLQEFGSDGHFFSQSQIREIVAYAADRGIRVVPEFDLPGHTTSWLVGHPEFAAGPAPAAIERRWGIFDPVMDPTNEALYSFLDGFLGEMAGLFPDSYLHIGGDEVNGVQWNASPRIQQFIRDHGLKDNEGLQAYFNSRLREILARHGKKMVGWDEILNPALPAGAVIESWRGADSLAAAARRGNPGILANGYYLDHMQSAAAHYRIDPLPEDTILTAAEQARVLGGEGAMWAEWVTPETIDSRIWPRMAAIAERFWSPRTVAAEDDLYRRLALVRRRLSEIGLQHESYLEPMLRRFAGAAADATEWQALRTVLDVLEPAKGYSRGAAQPDVTQLTPLTFLADCARPDSPAARDFAEQTDQFLFGPGAYDAAIAGKLEAELSAWAAAARQLVDQAAPRLPRIREAGPLLDGVAATCTLGAEALRAAAGGKKCSAEWRSDRLAAVARVGVPRLGVEIIIVAPVRRLICAAAAESERATMTAPAWREAVEKAAAPPAEAVR